MLDEGTTGASAVPADSPQVDAVIAAAPELLADSLSQYTKAWWQRIRSGDSGALPIIAGLVGVIIFFQVEQSKFLSSINIVNMLVQAAFFVVLGLGELFALLLSEIDLSVGFVAAIGGTITAALVSPDYGWPWWAAVIVGLLASGVLGALQGILITRLHLPSFVVTLGGLLGFGGLLIYIFDIVHGAVGGQIEINNNVLYNLVNGNMSPTAGWIALVVLVGLYAALTIGRSVRRRARGLSSSPLSISILTIVVVAAAGTALVAISNVNRASGVIPVSGLPWVIPVVLAIVMALTWFLGRTRTGRYIYAIGASPEAARRAGINVAWIRTIAFTLSAFVAGMAGIIYASRLGSISVGFDGGTYVLYAVAVAVIGGASLFGGRGKPIHALLGGVLLAVVVSGLALMGVSTAGSQMATAVVLIAAVTIDSVVRRRGTAGT
jgi:D-xylose transport system permease protein